MLVTVDTSQDTIWLLYVDASSNMCYIFVILDSSRDGILVLNDDVEAKT